MRQLNKRFGEIYQEITRQFDYLSATDLDDLAEDILDFNNFDDLLSWFEERISFYDQLNGIDTAFFYLMKYILGNRKDGLDNREEAKKYLPN